MRGVVPWKNTHVGSPEGEPSPAQGLTLGKHTSAGPGVREELQQGSPQGTELRSNKSARILSVEGNGAASVIDTEQVPVLLAI